MGSACSEVDNEHNQTIKNDTTTSAEETPSIKIILLGSKGGGKTTIWEHLKLLYCGGLQQEERERILINIKNDLIYNMKNIIESGQEKDHFYENELQEYARDILDIIFVDEALTPEIAHKIKALWDDPFTKIEYQNNIKFNLNDYAYFFFEKSEIIAQDDYVLTDEDVLKSYYSNGAIALNYLIIENKIISARLLDPDRRRLKECRPLRHTLETSKFLIFVVSLTDFCYFIDDDETTIRISEDSINMFENYANSDRFILKPILLIFNKKDLFERRLNVFMDEFQKAYPEFKGDIKNTDECIEYIKYCYLSKISKDRKQEAWVETLIISAFDEKNCQKLYQIIVSKILSS